MFENFELYLADAFVVIGAIVTIASVIVKLTPTKRDDEILAKIINVIDHFSVFNPNHIKVEKK